MDSSHAAHAPEAPPYDEYVGDATGGKVGMWTFIAQDGMAFGGLLLAYGVLRFTAHEWPVPSEILGIGLTASATFILILSSVSMVLAVEAAKFQQQSKLLFWLGLTILGGVAFLGIQAYEYNLLASQGIGFATSSGQYASVNNLFGSTFYAVTGFHGAHVTAGVIYLICIWIGAAKGKYTRGGISHSAVELVGLFWHFVDLVWILVFTFIYLL